MYLYLQCGISRFIVPVMGYSSYILNPGRDGAHLPLAVRAAGMVTPPMGYVENNDGKLRKYCGLFWCKSGAAAFAVNGTKFRLYPGFAACYYFFDAHDIRVDTADLVYYWMTFGGAAAEVYLRAFGFPRNRSFEAGAPPDELFTRLFASMRDFTLAARYRDAALAGEILLRAGAPRDDAPAESHESRLVLRFQDLVERGFADRSLDLNRLAAMLGVHRTTISRIVKKRFGTTPSAYIETCRLQNAMSMLHYSMQTAAQVAYACGFNDPAHFCRRFKAKTGMTPGAFRNQ